MGKRGSVLGVWRYAAYVMGEPETILHATGAEAEKVYKMACLCEPAPGTDSMAMANGLMQATPEVANVMDPAETQALTNLAYRLSRFLIGNQLANRFGYPRISVIGTLFPYRTRQRIAGTLKSESMVRSDNFTQLLRLSAYEDYGLSYEFPDHEKYSMSSPR